MLEVVLADATGDTAVSEVGEDPEARARRSSASRIRSSSSASSLSRVVSVCFLLAVSKEGLQR